MYFQARCSHHKVSKVGLVTGLAAAELTEERQSHNIRLQFVTAGAAPPAEIATPELRFRTRFSGKPRWRTENLELSCECGPDPVTLASGTRKNMKEPL